VSLLTFLPLPGGGPMDKQTNARGRLCSFSYQVSQLILAHVTKSPFPYWNGMMVYSLFGMIDANSQYLFGRYVFLSFAYSIPLHSSLFLPIIQRPITPCLVSSCSKPGADVTYRQPLVQNTPGAANVFIHMSFFVALFNYIRFAREVIWQM
jgi:ethanolaminephosphotransferase